MLNSGYVVFNRFQNFAGFLILILSNTITWLFSLPFYWLTIFILIENFYLTAKENKEKEKWIQDSWKYVMNMIQLMDLHDLLNNINLILMYPSFILSELLTKESKVTFNDIFTFFIVSVKQKIKYCKPQKSDTSRWDWKKGISHN